MTDPIGTAQELIEAVRDALWEDIQGTGLDVSPDDAEDLARAALNTPALLSRIAEVERLRETLRSVLEWWPEGSETGRASEKYGDGFSDDIANARAALL